ncbi:alpha/beta hydrolase [Terrabacter sp. NPDC080008]|uniref:alpha/beta fold hydrolase n=1 Tax=Terrabacter sp. NPDC080008 TaxID=3155176 RepID=UPI00344E65E0
MTGKQQTTSADGTTIAYEAYGSGPVVVTVGGAFCDRGTLRDTAQALGDLGLTGVTYDRRGRGDSGDHLAGAPTEEVRRQALGREVEDLRAVIAETSGNASAAGLFGVSSGGALVVEALSAGLPVASAAAFEVPYRTAAWPPEPEDYIGTLERFEAAGDREGILRYFNVDVVGMPEQAFEGMRGTPVWESLLALTYTVKYDGLCLGGDDQSLPRDVLARIGTPFLAVCSSGTAVPWLHDSATVLADALPDARAVELEGGFHQVPPPVLAPVLADFFQR